MNDYRPTDEQVETVAMFRLGQSLRVEAGAGTGKTSTLRLMASATRRIGQFVAFNRAVVEDAALVMPDNVACATSHALAFRAVGKRYQHRLDQGRVRSMEIARALRIDPISVKLPGGAKVLQPGHLASLAQRAVLNFCFSDAEKPGPEFMPYIDGIDNVDPDYGTREWKNNRIVREQLARPIAALWADICRTDGRLPFKPDHYMKIWALGINPTTGEAGATQPRIPGDFILLDEAQDTAPVLLGVLLQQDAQLVAVGDSQQALYEWRGAVNALAQIPAEATTFLTKSWRFGQPVADVANLILEQLDSPLRLTGCDQESRIGPIDGEPDAVLCRSNAEAVKTVLAAQARNVRVHLVGGGDEVASFARAAGQLQEGERTYHPELVCFDSWPEVRDYVAQDPGGSDLKLLVRMVEEFGVDTILRALELMPEERSAQLVVSTAHKSKGREWPQVRLASDYPEPEGGDFSPEYRLVYVAATRGRSVLDPRMCAPLQLLLDPPDEPESAPGAEPPLPWPTGEEQAVGHA